MSKYIYKDEEIKISNAVTDDDEIYYKVYVYDKFKGYLYSDFFSGVYGYAFGKSCRGRYYYTDVLKDSIEFLIEDLHRVYHMGKYAQGARL